jgi:glycosyltransferase involved in cell wall biosynthesis
MVDMRSNAFEGEKPRVAVIHLGARLHYEVPAILAESGLLGALYTDFALFAGKGIWPRFLAKLLPKAGRRLLARRLPACIPKARVRRFPWLTLRNAAYERTRPAVRKSPTFVAEKALGGHRLSAALIARRFEGANVLYVHPCVSTGAISAATEQGIFVCLEATSHPRSQFIEAEEHSRRGLVGPVSAEDLAANYRLFLHEAEMADVVLAASTYTAEGLRNAGISANKIAVVPYGIEDVAGLPRARPVVGRVLFVGSVGYLKGTPILAEAARLLKSAGLPYEIRAVGPYDRRLTARPELAGPCYVGQVPRSEVGREFAEADVFVFPTLSDGFGIVLIEALRAGLPIIATPNCADVVEHGVNGFLVPAHSVDAIAEAIKTIVSDRSLREGMSQHSRRIFRRFTREAYRERLVHAITSRFQTREVTRAANGSF